MINTIVHGDCLEVAKHMEPGSVDLILTDPPYGNMNTDGGRRLGINGWDFIISPDELFQTANTLLRKNGKSIFFSQEPYTSGLITKAIPNLPFSYRAIWEKDNFANCLGANKNMVSMFEDILVFSKTHDQEGLHPLREYFKSVMDYIGLNLKQINSKLGHRRAEHTFYIDSTQFGLCTQKTYTELIGVFGIDQMEGFIAYAELRKIDKKYDSTFNLWEGKKYKSNILKYKKDYGGLHPTQKPVLLLEDLIKTYSNPGDLVVDLTIGSGSTAVACINTGRNFIGIEKDEQYCKIACQRIEQHQ